MAKLTSASNTSANGARSSLRDTQTSTTSIGAGGRQNRGEDSPRGSKSKASEATIDILTEKKTWLSQGMYAVGSVDAFRNPQRLSRQVCREVSSRMRREY
ncbi:hypothetical protein GWI33_020364 [Rhynchophorus ferrugineus]|uniref:Uncharacterized protein n=1 Tax=Rhynchophorus ferrugineus TaxID=354439 RepID=A0A834LZJ4_RHYFE|nr:hypothetical protein GWI33_020364 [Rhynchophorus ferrugineus]